MTVKCGQCKKDFSPKRIFSRSTGKCPLCTKRAGSLRHWRRNKLEISIRRHDYQMQRIKMPVVRFSLAKSKCKRKKIFWGLSYKEYVPLILLNCFYCRESLNSTGVGLDRVDNSKGYEIGNVVPCCGTCNNMKSNSSQKDFIEKCRKIVSVRNDYLEELKKKG